MTRKAYRYHCRGTVIIQPASSLPGHRVLPASHPWEEHPTGLQYSSAPDQSHYALESITWDCILLNLAKSTPKCYVYVKDVKRCERCRLDPMGAGHKRQPAGKSSPSGSEIDLGQLL